jgi:hypothetical protein
MWSFLRVFLLTTSGAGMAFLLFNPFVALAVFGGNLLLLNVAKSKNSNLFPLTIFGIVVSFLVIVVRLVVGN